MKKLKFEWYVLNGRFPYCKSDKACRIIPFNIFSNLRVNEATNKLCKEYKSKKMSFDDFVLALDSIIKYEEWSRCEYEICVADWPPVYRGKDDKVIHIYYGQAHEPIEDVDMWKIDCYTQAHMNIKLIAKYVLETYYPKLKIDLETEEIE